MARIRTIKPDFWTDEKLTECSLSARLLFIGTWNFADDNGNLQASARKLKMQIFPADNIDCQPLLDELIAHGVLTEYSVNDEKFLHIKGFIKHQVINRPTPSKIPQPVLTESSCMEGKGKELNTPRRKSASETYDDFPDFVIFWEKYFRKDDKKKAFLAWKKATPSLDVVLAALEWQAPLYLSRESQYRPLASTYINGARWEDQQPNLPQSARAKGVVL